MRICMLVRNPFTRDARVLREATALVESGHEVLVIASAEPGLPLTEMRDGIRVRRVVLVPWWIRRVAGRSPFPTQEGGLAPGPAKLAGFRPAPAVLARDVWVTRKLTAAALRVRADVYHAHDLNTLEAAASAAERHGAGLVYDAHELYPEISGLSSVERARWSRIERRSIGRADRIVTVSDSLADELVARYGVGRPAVVRNTPDAAADAAAAPSPLAAHRRAGEMLVLYSGGLSANRGLEALADAAGRARGWHLVVMGWGPLERALRARNPAVAFVPPVAPGAVVAAGAAADVGVIPYLPVGLNNALSLPNKLFEYVQAGLAVAASDLVELRRFLDEERCGVTFPPGDAAAITAELDRLAAAPASLAAMRDAARSAGLRHTWSNEKAKLLALYEELTR